MTSTQPRVSQLTNFNLINQDIPLSEGGGDVLYYTRTFLLNFLLIAINLSIYYTPSCQIGSLELSRVTITKTILSKIYHRLSKSKSNNLEKPLDEASNIKSKTDMPSHLNIETMKVYEFDNFLEDMETLSKNKSKKGYEEI